MNPILNNKTLWVEKLKTASEHNMQRQNFAPRKILVEVAAQHPLWKGMEPDTEFSTRLDFCADLYKRLQITDETEIYVPGSLHIPDSVSLSEAGIRYLVGKGIPITALHGIDIEDEFQSERYWAGTYNSADECYLAARYFHKHKFNSLYCICSPIQVFRKMLFYIQLDIVPLIYTVPIDKPFHNLTFELYDQIPFILNNIPKTDGTQVVDEEGPWKSDDFFIGRGYFQNQDCEQAEYYRKTRMPGYITKSHTDSNDPA